MNTSAEKRMVTVRMATAEGSDLSSSVEIGEVLRAIERRLAGRFGGAMALAEDVLTAFSVTGSDVRGQRDRYFVGQTEIVVPAEIRVLPGAASLLDRVDLINEWIRNAARS